MLHQAASTIPKGFVSWLDNFWVWSFQKQKKSTRVTLEAGSESCLVHTSLCCSGNQFVSFRQRRYCPGLAETSLRETVSSFLFSYLVSDFSYENYRVLYFCDMISSGSAANFISAPVIRAPVLFREHNCLLQWIRLLGNTHLMRIWWKRKALPPCWRRMQLVAWQLEKSSYVPT